MKTLLWRTISLSFLAGLLSSPVVLAGVDYENYTFSTLAGQPEAGAGSSDGPGSQARFNYPGTIAVDANLNVYVADSENHTIRKITPAGMVSTVAGLAGKAGAQDGKGASARLDYPCGITVDASGNLYVADTLNHAVRKISPSGEVTTLAGALGVSGTNDGTGAMARFNSPESLTLAPNGNLYVADTYSHTIRQVTPDGTVTTLAGLAGHSGSSNGKGKTARFDYPEGIVADANSILWVADTYNHAIRRVTTDGAVTTWAGTAEKSGDTGNTRTTALFNHPFGVAVDGQENLYVADTGNCTIRKISADGSVTTLAGTAASTGSIDGTNSAARFYYPCGLFCDRNGNLAVADTYNHTIRFVTAAGAVSTLAGIAVASGTNDGAASNARFFFETSVAAGPDGMIYVADYRNSAIRKISPGGDVSTLAGLPGTSGTNDGNGSSARFYYPVAVTVDSHTNVLVADTSNHSIRKISPDGQVITLAGLTGSSGSTDGTGTNARFTSPEGITVDSSDNVYVADTGNNTIRRISPAGQVSTMAGKIGVTGTNNANGTNATFSTPQGIVCDDQGNLYVADNRNSAIRKITPNGDVTTFAGLIGATGNDDGPAANARFYYPFGLARDTNGNLYVGDSGNNSIRKITPEGVVTTVAGSTNSAGSINGTGRDARFNSPEGVAVDSQGNVYVADASNHSIRKGAPALSDTPFADLVRTNLPGITRQFSISNRTTTSWSWNLVRYPSTASAQLSSTNTQNPTLAPDVQDVFTVRFQGWDSQGRAAIGTVSVAVDAPPALLITNPVSDQQIGTASYTVSGTASDDVGVTAVWYQLNGGNWTQATGTTNWSAPVTVVGGANTFSAYAVDTVGNVSMTNSVSFTLATEKIAPTLIITTPKANLRVSNETYTVTGKAADKGGVASVWVKLNNGAWTQATGTTSWSSSLSLTPGTNLLWAYAKDTSANCSKTNSVKFVYVLSAPLTVETTGLGTLSPNYANAMLEINKNYAITATPSKNGYLFSNWTDNVHGVLTNGTKVTFTMASNLVLTANFATNLFTVTAGTYAGLFQPQDPTQAAHTNSGYFTATLGNKGAFSAKLLLGGTSYSLSGTFPVSGIYAGSITRKGLTSISVQLTNDLTGSNTITGVLSADGWQAVLWSDRAMYATTKSAPLGGKKFTLAIEGTNAPSSSLPGSYGAGALSVSTAGVISFAGTLSDGTKVTQSTTLSRYGQWPLYVALYSGKGSVRGWLNFTNQGSNSPSGSLTWSKNDPKAKVYSAPFNLTETNADLQVIGSPYSFTAGTPVLNLSNGIVQLQDGNLSAAVATGVTLGSNNKLTPLDKKVSLTLTTASGLFSGKVPVVLGGKTTTVSINGAVLQNQNAGFGSFLGTSESGSVTLGNVVP